MFKLLLENKTCIITGASKGIGYETARLFVEEGCKVIMIARNVEKLN
jgi:3-oxoacyl-[acyl-carrier protein] reductase